LELAKIENPVKVDGKSLVPLLQNQSPEDLEDRALFWHYPHYGNQGGDPAAIIRKGDWKLIHYFEDGKNEMYHLGNDPEETTDLYEKNMALGTTLKSELEHWLSSTNAKIPQMDPQYNQEEETAWLLQHKQKTKQRVEKRRAFQLSPDYRPNEDWWGSTTID
jgi:arylsulfatase A-like enzyme